MPTESGDYGEAGDGTGKASVHPAGRSNVGSSVQLGANRDGRRAHLRLRSPEMDFELSHFLSKVGLEFYLPQFHDLGVSLESDLALVEAEDLHALEPPLNKIQLRRWHRAVQSLKVRDDHVQPSPPTTPSSGRRTRPQSGGRRTSEGGVRPGNLRMITETETGGGGLVVSSVLNPILRRDATELGGYSNPSSTRSSLNSDVGIRYSSRRSSASTSSRSTASTSSTRSSARSNYGEYERPHSSASSVRSGGGTSFADASSVQSSGSRASRHRATISDASSHYSAASRASLSEDGAFGGGTVVGGAASPVAWSDEEQDFFSAAHEGSVDSSRTNRRPRRSNRDSSSGRRERRREHRDFISTDDNTDDERGREPGGERERRRHRHRSRHRRDHDNHRGSSSSRRKRRERRRAERRASRRATKNWQNTRTRVFALVQFNRLMLQVRKEREQELELETKIGQSSTTISEGNDATPCGIEGSKDGGFAEFGPEKPVPLGVNGGADGDSSHRSTFVQDASTAGTPSGMVSV